MKLMNSQVDLGAESGEDAQRSTAVFEARLRALRECRRDIAAEINEQRRIDFDLDEAELLIELERNEEAHRLARSGFDSAMHEKSWQQAVRSCDLIFECGLDDALIALGQGVWLSVSFPIEPELTMTMLQHIIDDTPDDADGAAVAAATALYVINLRATGRVLEDLQFFANQMIANVARRHSDITEQSAFDHWVKRMELDDPEKFLVRLRNIVDVLVQDEWWFDRDRVRDDMPTH